MAGETDSINVLAQTLGYSTQTFFDTFIFSTTARPQLTNRRPPPSLTSHHRHRLINRAVNIGPKPLLPTTPFLPFLTTQLHKDTSARIKYRYSPGTSCLVEPLSFITPSGMSDMTLCHSDMQRQPIMERPDTPAGRDVNNTPNRWIRLDGRTHASID